MNIAKTKSGTYKIREMKDGKTYIKTIDHKPTQREARAIMDELIREREVLDPSLYEKGGTTFAKGWIAFRSAKEKVLSPSTLRGYVKCYRSLPEWFTALPITKIHKQHLQKLINDFSAGHAPKTCRNLLGFVTAILSFYEITPPSIKLPQARPEPVYIPSKEDVSRLLKACSGSRYEAAIRLGAYGLRRSEIMALTIEDLSPENVLTINKALVESEQGNVLKGTKTTSSARTVILSPDLADLIRKQGFIYDGSPGRLTNALRRFEDQAGIPHFPLHKLRHFFASYMHDLGFSEAQIQEAGGWSDASHVMKQIYRHAMEMNEAKLEMSRKLSEL